MCGAHNKKRWFLRGFLFVLVFIGVLSLVVMLLWNWLMPLIFGLGTISYFEASGLLILSKILFTGIGKKPSQYYYGRRKYWHERFEKENPDEGTSTTTV